MKNIEAEKLIKYNIKAHDLIASNYERAHVEIYNPTEQNRIKDIFKNAILEISTASTRPLALDFGAGTGNLTRHLCEMQVDTIAADVSKGILNQLKRNLRNYSNIKTVLTNGMDLSIFNDNVFDMVATYSVLHHVPDYLKIISEFTRIVKPGGVIYIDHEVCPSYWEYNEEYQNYLRQLGDRFHRAHLSELGVPSDQDVSSSMVKKCRKTVSLRELIKILKRIYKWQSVSQSEGDIHVQLHDHIDWEAIKFQLSHSCEVINESDYLICREMEDNPKIWKQFNQRCKDMRLIIVKKSVPMPDKLFPSKT